MSHIVHIMMMPIWIVTMLPVGIHAAVNAAVSTVVVRVLFVLFGAGDRLKANDRLFVARSELYTHGIHLIRDEMDGLEVRESLINELVLFEIFLSLLMIPAGLLLFVGDENTNIVALKIMAGVTGSFYAVMSLCMHIFAKELIHGGPDGD